MISTAITLSILTTGAFVIVYGKLPKRLRAFIEKHSLLTDLLALIGVYILFGGTLTALMAGALTGLTVSGLLHIVNHKEDFLYLYDLRDFVKEKLNQAKAALNEFGAQYRAKKALAATSVEQC